MRANEEYGDVRVGIIGGGVAGLTAAYELSRSGHQVSVFEKEDQLGGLASSFRLGDHWLDRYYHFICGGDEDLLNLLAELRLGDSVMWADVKTGHFQNGRLYSFSSPLDIMRFGAISWPARLRFGLHVVRSRYMDSWRRIEGKGAQEWLTQFVGREAYEAIWHPLLSVKFGDYHARISAAWIWHRIHRVAKSRKKLLVSETYGYIAGTTRLLLQTLRERIEQNGGKVLVNSEVAGITGSADCVDGLVIDGAVQSFDHVISTVPLPRFIDLARSLAPEYCARLATIDYLGVVCVVLRARAGVSSYWWLNTNDPRIPFNGLIEYSNLCAWPQLNGDSLIYVPFYVPPLHERFRRPDAELVSECVSAIQVINPSFTADKLVDSWVFRDRCAQAV